MKKIKAELIDGSKTKALNKVTTKKKSYENL